MWNPLPLLSTALLNCFLLVLSQQAFECPARFGYFADRKSCTKYFICNFGFGVVQECPNGLQFSTKLRNCDWIINVNCTQYPGVAYREEDGGPPPVTDPPTTTELFLFPQKDSRFPSISAQIPQRPKNSNRPELQVCLAPPCTKTNCKSPNCRCGSSDIPNSLDPEETPQMVMITFENAVTEWSGSVFESMFRDSLKNPNGCPVRGTFFVSHEWTDYSLVQNLYSKGHEIGVLGITLGYKQNRSMADWENEVAGQRRIIGHFANVSSHDIHGMRAPYLAIGGDEQFTMLYKNDFVFDSSMPVFENEPPFFPFTLDCRINNVCMVDPCPNNSYPGIWELPVVMWTDLSGSRCNTVDSCTDPATAQEVYELLMSNFHRHYSTNRAPFNIFLSAAWFANDINARAFRKFMESMLGFKDVYVISMSQVLEWMKNPVPVSRLSELKSWTCGETISSSRTGPCLTPNICTPWFEKTKEIRPFKTCMPCPKNYPWIGNEEGR